MNGLDLFSGIGGLSLALKEWVRPIAYCESDPYCQGVLLSSERIGGMLNPTWVEWLMGYPAEWTVCAPWAMPLSHVKRAKPSKD